MERRSIALALVVAALSGCAGSSSGARPAPLAADQHAREIRSLSGGASGNMKLTAGSKPNCTPAGDTWTIAGSVIGISIGHTAFIALSTMSLPSTAAVTFTNSEPTGSSAALVVSSSSTSYTAAGSFSGLVWTPPSAGTFYAGYLQEWEANDGCGGSVTVYDGSFSFTWTQ
jgi:hypothetical protein